jgi:hypothetical protein
MRFQQTDRLLARAVTGTTAIIEVLCDLQKPATGKGQSASCSSLSTLRTTNSVQNVDGFLRFRMKHITADSVQRARRKESLIP